jgi:hypothetical protein
MAMPKRSKADIPCKDDPPDSAIGLSPVEAGYGTTTSDQPFLPMTPPRSPLLTSDHGPYQKEDQGQFHASISSMPRTMTPGSLLHQQRTLDSFCLVHGPAAYPGFASSAKVCFHLTIAYTSLSNPKAGQGVLMLPLTKQRERILACLFCRERKIACEAPLGPPLGSTDTTCKQCARRSMKCYPTKSQRGLRGRHDNCGGHRRESMDADYVPTA